MTLQFEQLLIDHMPRLRAYAQTLTGDSADADDLTQTTALRVLKYESQFKVGTNFSAWAYRILRNGFLSDCRNKSRRPSTSLDAMPEDASLSLSLACPARQEEHVFGREVIRAMDKLKPKCRRTLALVCGAELSYQDAAALMSCNVGTVKSRLWRGRERMKVLLQGSGEAVAA